MKINDNMKLHGKLIAFVIAAASAVNAAGQSDVTMTGITLTAAQFTPMDMMQFSQSYNSFTTARASALGGAFTALGGDLASMTINPAGIGMYRSSAWGFTPSLNITSNRNATDYGSDNATRMALNNIGMVIHMSERSRGVVSFNLGISYNRLADYNSNGNLQLYGPAAGSLLNVLQLQANGLYNYLDTGRWAPLPESDLRDDPYNNYDIYVDEWGAVLAYQNGLLSPGDEGYYALSGIPTGGVSSASLGYSSRGSAGEYNIAAGMNVNNILYLGLNLAVQDISRNLTLSYTEAYNVGANDRNSLRHMRYNQYSYTAGSAVAFKAGAIIRPFPSLRIGIVYHSPSYVSMQREYQADMNTSASNYRTAGTLIAESGYDYVSPSRLAVGAAYTVGDFMALSFDYERVWYNSMRLSSDSKALQDSFHNSIVADFRAVDNFRAGIEVKPLASFALRAGYAYYGSPLANDSDRIYSNLLTTSSHHISVGAGCRVSRSTSIDLAYIYSRYRTAPLDLFYYSGPARLAQVMKDAVYHPGGNIPSGFINRHTLTLSFSFLF